MYSSQQETKAEGKEWESGRLTLNMNSCGHTFHKNNNPGALERIVRKGRSGGAGTDVAVRGSLWFPKECLPDLEYAWEPDSSGVTNCDCSAEINFGKKVPPCVLVTHRGRIFLTVSVGQSLEANVHHVLSPTRSLTLR